MKWLTFIVVISALSIITVAAYVIGLHCEPTLRFLVYYLAGSLATLLALLIIEFT